MVRKPEQLLYASYIFSFEFYFICKAQNSLARVAQNHAEQNYRHKGCEPHCIGVCDVILFYYIASPVEHHKVCYIKFKRVTADKTECL